MPLVADTVTVESCSAFETVKVDVEATVGADSLDGRTVSIVSVRVADAGDATLLVSTRAADTVQLPSASNGRSHDVTEDIAVTTHERLSEPFVAVTVTVSPVLVPETCSVGVLSLVTLSSDLSPESEEVARSGVDGAAMTTGARTRSEFDVAVVAPMMFVWVSTAR